MNQFRNILAVADSGAETNPALRRAAALAEQHEAALKIVDVVRDYAWPWRLITHDYDHVREQYAQEKQQFLDSVAAPLRDQGLKVAIKVLRGRSSIEIMKEVLRDGHDLVIKRAKGQQSRRSGFFGTTAMQLLRQCACAVWLTKPGHEGPNERVLAAVDATPDDQDHAALNGEIMNLAASACATDSGRLHVAYAWDIFGESMLRTRMPPGEFADLMRTLADENERSFAQLLDEHGLCLQSDLIHLVHGDPSRVIPQVVAEANIDLLVMGTVARTGMAGLLMGNTADRILEGVECSVLATKPPGFVCPVVLNG